MKTNYLKHSFLVGILLCSLFTNQLFGADITGELKTWHKVTLTFTGPNTSETANPNPFTDYRLNVTFTGPSGQVYVVPGYYAADGNASETSANSGNKWRCHLAPDETGEWSYSVSFRTGANVAVSDNATAGTATSFDGETGTFTISATDKTGRDHRGKGRLEYVGEHHLRFAGTGEYFIKAGADAPENFLAYVEFDNTTYENNGKPDNTKTWSPHISDWNTGDPTWQSGKGKGIIGAINYLAGKGMNVFSFLTMNIAGDDRMVWPYTEYTERLRFDCSKLDQWEIVFEHGDKLGMYLHFKTQETENDGLLDGGALGTERKLYYRELIARFGHHLALNWNMGEENTNTDGQRKDFAQYFYDHDPYRHNVVIHTYPGQIDQVYTPLKGTASKYTGISIQTGWSNVHSKTVQWVNESAAAGVKWVVANDEQGSANIGVPHDAHTGSPNKHGIRQQTLWGNFMGGGAGVEYYFGYSLPHSDLTCEDFRSRDDSWTYAKYALDFFYDYIPFWEMSPSDNLTSNGWCLAKTGQVYLVYLPSGGTANLTVTAGDYEVKWYDPRNGGALQSGSVSAFSGAGTHSIGNPPNNSSSDWACLVQTNPGSPIVAITSPTEGDMIEIGNDISIAANASDSDGNITKVEYFSNGSKVGEDLNGPYNHTISSPSLGAYEIEVKATDNDGKTASSIVNVTVYDPSSMPVEHVFDPIDDAYLEGGTRNNNTQLKVEDNNRISYLKFDVSGIAGKTIQSVELKLTVDGDAGNGYLGVYEGSHNNWTEDNITSTNAPDMGTLLGSLDQTYSAGTEYSFTLTGITSDGTITLILDMTAGNDVWFSSSEGSATPQLAITTLGSSDSYSLNITANNGTVAKSPDKTEYNEGETVTLTASPNPGYEFVNWTGDASGTNTTVALTMDGDKSVTANFQATQNTYTLDVSVFNGSVTISPDKAEYNEGESVEIALTVSPGYEFTGWSGDATGTNNPLTITMDADKVITANVSETYALSMTSNNGSVVINPDKTNYSSGEPVTLTALPDAGYEFVSWSGDLSGSTNPVTITMDGNKIITANFSVTSNYTLNVVAGNGTVTKNPDKSSYTPGESVELCVTPAQCYEFDSWTGDVTGAAHCIFVVMDANKTVTPTYQVKLYGLTINSDHGTVSKSPGKQEYDCGESVTVTAVPDAGYVFTGWSGDLTGSNNPATITMDAAKSITANYATGQYILNTSAGSGGTITFNPDKASYNLGEVVEVCAVPATCNQFTGWSGDLSGTSLCQNIVMDGEKSINAGFEKITYNLTTTANNGVLIVSPDKSEYDCNETVTLTAYANQGYDFVGWDGDASGSASPLSITIDSDMSIEALFDIVEDIGDRSTNFEIYPNPCSDILRVQASSHVSNLVVRSITGVAMLEQSMESNKLDIDVSGLEPGVYLLEIQENNKRVVQSFIKN